MRKTLCIILLDTSGSMSGQFEGDHAATLSAEVVSAVNKIEAAKKWLIEELDGGLADAELALVTFDAEPRLTNVSADAMRAFIESLAANGRATDIAAALNLAVEAAAASKARFKTALLVTDGLSNQGEPVIAADVCRQNAIQVNTALIDPNPQTVALAELISKGGSVWLVQSAAAMRDAMASAAAPHATVARQGRTERNLVALTATLIGVAGTIAGILSGGFDKPGLLPWIVAVSLLCVIPLLVQALVARDVGAVVDAFGRPHEVKRHSLGVRIASGAALLACLASSITLLGVGWRMRQTLELRVVNESNYSLPDMKVTVPELDESYLLSVGPNQATEYRTLSPGFWRGLRLLIPHNRENGAVVVPRIVDRLGRKDGVISITILDVAGRYGLFVRNAVGDQAGITLHLNRE